MAAGSFKPIAVNPCVILLPAASLMAQNAAKVKLWIFSYPDTQTGDLTQLLLGFACGDSALDNRPIYPQRCVRTGL
jgi:hypothetical protein